jgi:hypothetical protein
MASESAKKKTFQTKVSVVNEFDIRKCYYNILSMHVYLANLKGNFVKKLFPN